MCLACGDADKGEKRKNCNGVLKPYLTLSQLMDDLMRESAKTGKTLFRIFKGILVNPPDETSLKKGDLTINFL